MFKYHRNIIVFFIVLVSAEVGAQDLNHMWKGNKAYRDLNYEEAEQNYLKSSEVLPGNDVTFNLGNALYKQKKYDEAAKLYKDIALKSENKSEKAEAYHNLGNALLKSQKLDESINAYKQALRNNPGDEETRYNLSYAMKMKQQEEQKDQNQDKKDQENKENKDQDKQEQENKDQEKQDKEEQNRNDKEEQQEQNREQPKPNEISKQDAERLLENLENEEEKTQEKMQLKRLKSKNTKIENDW